MLLPVEAVPRQRSSLNAKHGKISFQRRYFGLYDKPLERHGVGVRGFPSGVICSARVVVAFEVYDSVAVAQNVQVCYDTRKQAYRSFKKANLAVWQAMNTKSNET